MLSTIKSALLALKEFLHWMRVREEIEARRLYLIEMETIDDEIADLEGQMHAARSRNQHGLADRLQQQRTRRALYRAGVYSIGEGAGIHSAPEHDAGNGDSSSAEGRTDS